MKRLHLILSIFIFSTLSLFANDIEENKGTIKGIVTTSDTKPAALVTALLKGLKKTTITNDDGEFFFKNVSPGRYELEVSYVGYSKMEKTVIVEADKTTVVSFRLHENAAQLAEVLVSTNKKSYIAAKVSTSLKLNAELIEVPQNITVATKQTLTDMGLLVKSEISRISSAITKSDGEEIGITFQIRGINVDYGLYRNGVSGPIWWNNAQEDAAMIERMEFVKGPASFMLTNAEPGGLVNVVTKQPTHQRITEVGFGVGSWNLVRTHIDLGGEFKKEGKLTYRLNAGVEKKNEYYQFGDFYRYWICPVLKYDFNENTSLAFEHNYVKAAAQEDTHQSISINGDFEKLPVDFAINDPNNPKFWGSDAYNKLTFRHKINGNWTFNAQAAYVTTDWDGTAMQLARTNTTKDTLIRENYFSDWDGKLTSIQLFADGKFYTGKRAEHKVLIGIDYGTGNQGGTFGGTWGQNKFPLSINNPVYYLPEDTLTVNDDLKYGERLTNKWQALYIQDHLKLFDKVIITLAGRFTHLTTGENFNNPPTEPADKISDNKFTPRLGLTYMFSPNVSAYIMHDESFLPQSGAIFRGGRLPPLTGSNNEFGVKALLFKKQLSVTASLYDIRKNDIGISDPVHERFYLKTGQIRSAGADIDIAGRINANLYVNINYAYVNPRITRDEDETLIGLQNPGTCKNLANVWLKYQMNDGVLKGLGFGAGVQYTGKRSAVEPGENSSDGSKYLPAYTLFDAALSYTTRKFSINLNVYNLADRRYAAGGWWDAESKEFVFYQGTPNSFRLQTTIRL